MAKIPSKKSIQKRKPKPSQKNSSLHQRSNKQLAGIGLPPKKFQKRVENFICENCGAHVKGAGYTDHCPYCLWSKHVDINPGDRRCKCSGMMKPLSLEANSKGYVIHYKCHKCGYTHKVRSDKADSFAKMLELVSHYQ